MAYINMTALKLLFDKSKRHGLLQVRSCWTIPATAIVYILVAKANQLLLLNDLAAAIWAPSGIALSAVFLFGINCTVGIFMGSILYALMASIPTGHALILASSETLQAALAYTLLSLIPSFSIRLRKTSDVTIFVAIAVILMPLVFSAIGFFSFWTIGSANYQHDQRYFWVWLLGDSLGVLTFTLAILFLFTLSFTWNWRKFAELMLFVCSLTVILFTIFNTPFFLPYLVWPFLIWAAVRFGQFGIITSTLIIMIFTMYFTTNGSGPFVQNSTLITLIVMQGFLLITGLVALFLGTAIKSEEDHMQLKELLRQVRVAEDNFRTVLNNSLDIAYRRNLQSDKYEFLSPALTEITGYTVEEMTKWPTSETIAHVHPDDRANLMEQLTNNEDSGIVEYRFRTKDGSYKWFSDHYKILRDKNQIPQDRLGIVRDNTRRRESEENLSVAHDRLKKLYLELKSAKDAAEKANSAKSVFLANISHEIRTPLNAIVGFSEILQRNGVSPEDHREYLDIVCRNSRLLNVLIDDILDLSRIEAGQFSVEKNPTPTAKLIKDIQMVFEKRAQDKSINFTINEAADIPAILYTDQLRLHQILLNMIGNALKFTPINGAITLNISYDNSNKTIEFAVSDTGIGVPTDQYEAIFLPFHQADSSMSRRFGGTGLGLALSRKLATALGGTLVLQKSELQKGSTFVLTLPITAAAEHPLMTSEKIIVLNSAPTSLNELKILVVEDTPDSQFLIKRILETHGAHVDIASNGLDGVYKAMNGDFDLILMDIGLPIMDGYEATQKLREANYHKPIIALTAHAFSEERERALKSGCNSHLTKPVDIDELLKVLAGIIKPAIDRYDV